IVGRPEVPERPSERPAESGAPPSEAAPRTEAGREARKEIKPALTEDELSRILRILRERRRRS
ncbi:hypothetical protein DRO33_01095, partial [Candidatus Bathyarchaeota archaeon]